MTNKYYIYNWQQAYFYMKNGVMPLERPGVNKSSGKVYFIFGAEETKEVYSKWCNNIKQ
ncbi:hypothetical protein [Clostridium perfringens]|uniref:hypothetical protein n=1 Tax=Clostridium perfringens TaxID=1502 RepID=UPI001304B87A|nr:hypothetical protein [Clostridium perfringens]EGT0683774.1 hypothetical protein [Clostridium perfringens]EGT0686804.1 hypothetical protein [Clostridium perfringens]EIF2806963.1 hypothetical protein [Clostridium perfringens]EJT6154955.1 hypothetical protein [Clostridium perfringens]EJT6502820.1 hypothetical protein [Clostridium perfringens]